MKKIVLILFFLTAFSTMLFAGKSIGPNVSVYKGKELKWEEGARNYFVMFKTYLEDKNTGDDQGGKNPQGDACVDPSVGTTYTLGMGDVPLSAHVDKAFLIWTSAIGNQSEPTDNSVTLSFTQQNSTFSETQTITASRQGQIGDAKQDFEFESYTDPDDPTIQYYTYRVDVTDFFTKLHKDGVEHDLGFDGMALYGDYTVKDLNCTNASQYIDTTQMVGGWSLIMIYSYSAEENSDVKPKNIYIYNGFTGYWYKKDQITVSGFEFPAKPEVRVTLGTFEGDPGLANVFEPTGGPNPGGIAPAEGLQVKGGGPDFLLLSNKCNPEQMKQNQGQTLKYTEIFNSVSSVYGYDSKEPDCVGGTPPNYDTSKMQFGMDIDTFVMDAGSEAKYANHFYKGGQTIDFLIGANQDFIITNFMVVSVDTKKPDFDGPGREKIACANTDEEDRICSNSSFYYAIRVQNFGDDVASNVAVKDEIFSQQKSLSYVSGTTVMATEFASNDPTDKVKYWKATKWIQIPDKKGGANNGFPLNDYYVVAKSLKNYASEPCDERVLVRFKVKSGKIEKNAIIPNTAYIKSAEGGREYGTNTNVPLKLTVATSCKEKVNLDLCGGELTPPKTCKTNDDCDWGEKCENSNCVADNSIKPTKDAVIKVYEGINSPKTTTDGAIVIDAPKKSLLVGQLVLEEQTKEKNKYFTLSQLKISVEKESKVILKNMQLVEDTNGNGKKDAGENIVSTASTLQSNMINFSINEKYRKLDSSKPHFFIILLDASYNGSKPTANSIFKLTLPTTLSNVVLADSGSPKISNNESEIDFATFMFEPTNGFIITKGEHDPEVSQNPSGNTAMLQLRIKSKSANDVLNSLTISTATGSSKFGDGIKNIAIYQDTNNDGKGDKKIAETSSFSSASKVVLKNLKITVLKDKNLYLVVQANLSLAKGKFAQILVSQASVESDSIIYKLPIISKKFMAWEDGVTPEEEDGGCGCSTVDTRNSNNISAIFLLLSLLGLIIFKKTLTNKK